MGEALMGCWSGVPSMAAGASKASEEARKFRLRGVSGMTNILLLLVFCFGGGFYVEDPTGSSPQPRR